MTKHFIITIELYSIVYGIMVYGIVYGIIASLMLVLFQAHCIYFSPHAFNAPIRRNDYPHFTEEKT